MGPHWKKIVIVGAGILGMTGGLAGCTSEVDSAPSNQQNEIVTLAVYKQALEATKSCVNEAGFDTSELRISPDGVLWSFQISSSGPGDDSGIEAYDHCRPIHLEEIERAYFAANIPTGAKRDELVTEMIECLESAGVEGVTHAMVETEIVSAIVDQFPNDFTPGLLCLENARMAFPEGLLGQ